MPASKQQPPRRRHRHRHHRHPKPRGHIAITRIADNHARNLSFSKRKKGLLKKANELAELTGAQVGVIVVSESGHMWRSASSGPVRAALESFGRTTSNVPTIDATASSSAAGHGDPDGLVTPPPPPTGQQTPDTIAPDDVLLEEVDV